MIRNIILFISSFIIINVMIEAKSQQSSKNTDYIVMKTSMGSMVIKLYDNTPFHKENFIKLINEDFYDVTLFHRVIKDFMIQGGDPDSRNAKPGEMLGRGGPGYTVPAEFRPEYYHKKGALCAARQGDQINPTKASSGSQFYLVKGKIYTDKELDYMEQSGMHIKFTPEQRQIYKSIGGTPHLDYSYTVFGEVVDGLDLIDKISEVPTDQRDRPLNDIKIIDIYFK